MQFMSKSSRYFAILAALSFAFSFQLAAQDAPKPTPTKPDYSKEAFVDEDDTSKLSFENDGTCMRETSTRIRIQSDAGVQHFGVLTFPYQSANETMEIEYVRVRKPDGTVVTTPNDSAQDMPSEVTRQAPFYSDLHEKHFAVKGLAPGDTLEYAARWHLTKPLAPGQFWFAHNFAHDFIVLHEEIQVSIPKDRAVKWKSPNNQPKIVEDAGRRIFTWSSSQLQQKSDDEQKKEAEDKLYYTARGRLPPPDVQMSTFQTWAEVGAWYNSLQSERVKPSQEIRVKAAVLTKDAKDDDAKLHAIYTYVSTQFRYIGVAFGIGRYQPHSADEVLANQYGDCKDRHTLLASLLEAAGIKAYPALIGATHELDPDVPSPAQFDHVITAVPRGDGFVWLDTTAEVAPYGYLLSVLNSKHSLLVYPQKPAELMTTPSQSLTGTDQFRIDASLNESGTLEGKVKRTFTGGDAEVLFRAAFRKLPMTQWKDFVQQLSYASGFGGDVGSVTASSPDKIDEPFEIEYNYTRKDFPDWSDHKIASGLPRVLLQVPDSKPEHPVAWGAIHTFRYEAHITLPAGYGAELPAQIDRDVDFASYNIGYSIKDGVLTINQTLIAKALEIPVAQYEAFKTFSKSISENYDLRIPLISKSSPATRTYQDEIWALPYSENADASQAYESAREAYQRKDTQAEIDALKRATNIDPKFQRAWLWLGEIYKYSGQRDLAIQSYRKAVEIDPNQLVSYKALGYALSGMKKYEEAASTWQELLKRSPQNAEGLTNLGFALYNLKRYGEAASAIQSAIDVLPGSPNLWVLLGTYKLRAGQEEEALAAYHKAVGFDGKPLWYNNIAYALAEADKQLPMALQYSLKAVRDEEEESAAITLSDLRKEDLQTPGSIDAYWDTLGWVYFREGNYDMAEKYLNAAWELSQGATEADHLGQVYEKQGKTKAAIHMYQLALAVSGKGLAISTTMPETRGRLEHLSPGASATTAVFAATPELSTARTFKMPRLTKETASAEFFVLLSAGSTEVKFVSGSEVLKSATDAVKSVNFRAPFPDKGPTLVLRRGILSCYSVTGCTFVLYNLSDVRSVN